MGLTAISQKKQTNGAGFIYPTIRLTVPALRDVVFVVGLFSSPRVVFDMFELSHIFEVKVTIVEAVGVVVMAE